MADSRKTYAAPWNGRLILACRKCQKKLKSDLPALARLKRTLKQRNKLHPGHPLHVLNVSCMDVCPKGGVTICDPARDPARLSILRKEEDVEALVNATNADKL